MKNLILVLAMAMSTMFMAQSTNVEKGKQATQVGNYTVGLSSTNLGFTNVDKSTTLNVGLDAGYFVAPQLAVKASVGYTSTHFKDFNSNDWSYGVGVKYYVAGVVPVQVDWNGSTGNNFNPSSSFVGTQLGYAFYPSSSFSIEPALRYNISTDKKVDSNVFSGAVSFNLFF